MKLGHVKPLCIKPYLEILSFSMQVNFPGSRIKFPGKREGPKSKISQETGSREFPGASSTDEQYPNQSLLFTYVSLSSALEI